MYLSRVVLNTNSPKVRVAIRNPIIFHGAIASTINDERPLWRTDNYKGMPVVYILTDSEPDLTSFVEQFGISCESKEMSKLLNSDKTTWRFKIVANPTVCRNHKKVALNDEIDQLEWISRKLEGADVLSCKVLENNNIEFFHKSSTAKFKAVTYEGLLDINNKESFFKVLREGIGREKAFGMGLLTLVPVNA